MLVGYARTSTLEQEHGLAAQIDELRAAGVEKLFQEQTSARGPRPQLEAALSFVREGDVLVVTRLDRLARSTRHLLQIVQDLEMMGASLRVLNLNLDTRTATGKLMLTMIGAVAEFERDLMLERQVEGIKRAAAAGKYKGRAPTARAKTGEVMRLKAEGIGPSEIARRLGISRASVHRIVGTKKAA